MPECSWLPWVANVSTSPALMTWDNAANTSSVSSREAMSTMSLTSLAGRFLSAYSWLGARVGQTPPGVAGPSPDTPPAARQCETYVVQSLSPPGLPDTPVGPNQSCARN